MNVNQNKMLLGMLHMPVFNICLQKFLKGVDCDMYNVIKMTYKGVVGPYISSITTFFFLQDLQTR
jgi:hypothetical protein